MIWPFDPPSATLTDRWRGPWQSAGFVEDLGILQVIVGSPAQWIGTVLRMCWGCALVRARNCKIWQVERRQSQSRCPA